MKKKRQPSTKKIKEFKGFDCCSDRILPISDSPCCMDDFRFRATIDISKYNPINLIQINDIC